MSDTVFRKIYLSLYWKGREWEGVGDRTEQQHIDPHSYGQNSISFLFSWAAKPGAWGPSLSGCWFSLQHLFSNCNCSIGGLRAHSAGCWLSLPHLVSNWLNFLCTELYNSSTSTFFLWRHKSHSFHGQGYILIFLDWMHLLFTQMHFLFWQPGWAGGQYTTQREFAVQIDFFFLWICL